MGKKKKKNRKNQKKFEKDVIKINDESIFDEKENDNFEIIDDFEDDEFIDEFEDEKSEDVFEVENEEDIDDFDEEEFIDEFEDENPEDVFEIEDDDSFADEEDIDVFTDEDFIDEFEDTEEISEVSYDDNFEIESDKESFIDRIFKNSMLFSTIDIKSVLLKLGILMILAFVFIFAYTKIFNSKDEFPQHLEKMQEVAYIYYKVASHRPVSVGDEVSMTLLDMEQGSLISELKVKKNVCSKDYSYVSLKKNSDINYRLTIYLSCGGESETANYDVVYQGESSSETEKVVLYELRRNVSSTYSCPSGYVLSGKYCLYEGDAEVIAATPKYRVTPERSVAANFKPSNSTYETIDPIVSLDTTYSCPNGYELSNGKCIMSIEPRYKRVTTYVCAEGVVSGTKCLITRIIDNVSELSCKNGSLVDGKCYVSRASDLDCLLGKKDASKNACYTSYEAYENYGEWLFEKAVIYSKNIVLKDTETTKYEKKETLSDGRVKYFVYARKPVYSCEANDTLVSKTCRHYDTRYEQRYCKSSSYSLSSDKSSCYYYEEAQRNVKKSCPDGFKVRGDECYKYETASKNTLDVPSCISSYELTQDNKCVKSLEPDVSYFVYSCPDGYEKRGSGSSISCYKKTTSESYYYCSNTSYRLEGKRCIIPEKTTFVSYSCPSSYELSGSECIKTKKEKILATKDESGSSSDEIIWSHTKEVDGWTWTGNTKEV